MPKSDTLCPRFVCGFIRCGLLYESRDCTEGGDDLVPISWSAFGRTVRVGVDGCLTGHIFFITRQLDAGLRGRTEDGGLHWCSFISESAKSLLRAYDLAILETTARIYGVHNIQGSIG